MQSDAHIDPLTVKSHSGWVICFAGCPIWGLSKLQTVSALSTTEAEYIALSLSLQDIILLMGLLKETRQYSFNILDNAPKIHCKFLRTIVVVWNLPIYQRFILRQNISISTSIIFMNRYSERKLPCIPHPLFISMLTCSTNPFQKNLFIVIAIQF